MIRLSGRVELKTGELVEWRAGTAAMAEWELYAHRHGYPTDPRQMASLSMLVIAHYALRGSSEGFEAWRVDVVDVDVDLDETLVPPTLQEVSGG